MLSSRLVRLRKSKNLTQQELADKLNISRATYAQYEIGRREPDYDTLLRIAEFYDVSTDYLLGKESDRVYGTDPDENPLGIRISEEQALLLQEMSKDPDTILMFFDFASATEDEKRMMLDIWASIRKRNKPNEDKK